MINTKSYYTQIVILDLNLPATSGKEALTYIHTDERLAKTRVMLTTADDLQAETLNNDADLVLLKAVGPMQLRELAPRLSSSQYHFLSRDLRPGGAREFVNKKPSEIFVRSLSEGWLTCPVG